MESSWNEGTKVCSNGPGHMNKVAAMPIYVKNFKTIFFSGIKRLMTLKLGMQHRLSCTSPFPNWCLGQGVEFDGIGS